jgi:hypothetical protein
MAIIDYTSVDFDTLKADLQNYISNTTTFNDYNIEGSNLDFLIRILTYITNILSINQNLAISESFLPTVQLRKNVLSIIKTLNYTPYTTSSSKVEVDLSNITLTGTSGSGNLLKYDKIKGNNLNFYYVGDRKQVFNNTVSTAMFYEGTLHVNTSSYTGDDTSYQSFIIENTRLGDYLKIFTIDELGSRTYWEQFDEGTVYSSPGTEYIYFFTEVENGYQISFGNNMLGRIVSLNEIIGYEYIEPTEDNNDVTEFTWEGGGADEEINSSYTGKIISDATITISSTNTLGSYGYTEKETIEEIKFTAPKFWSTHGRAVTDDDYYAIALRHSWIGKAKVIGGENVTNYAGTIQLGKVFIYVVPDSNNYQLVEFTDNDLSTLEEYFDEYKVITITPICYNAQRIYIRSTSTLRHITDEAPDTESVRTALINFINEENSNFGEYLEYSKYIETINNSDDLITSHLTTREIYTKINSTNKTYDVYGDEIYGVYRIQLSKNLLDTLLSSTQKTKIETFNYYTKLPYVYEEDVDYTISYDDFDTSGTRTSNTGYVTITFIESGTGLDLDTSTTGNVNVRSIYTNGSNDNRLYILGDNKASLTITDVEGNYIYYGTTTSTEAITGNYIHITSGESKNQIFRITNIGSYIPSGEDETFYIEVTPVTPDADITDLVLDDTFDIYEPAPDVTSTGYNLQPDSLINITDVPTSYVGYYKVDATNPIYYDDSNNIYLKLNTTYKELPTTTQSILKTLNIEDGVIYTSSQYMYKLFFHTQDNDVFLQDSQVFAIETDENYDDYDISFTTEKVTI